VELAIVSHFFSYTFEYLSECALSKTFLLKDRKDTFGKKSEISACFAKDLLITLSNAYANSTASTPLESDLGNKEATVSETG